MTSRLIDMDKDLQTDEQVSVLLVDDRNENLLALESMLAGPLLRIIKARSGDEALRSLLTEDVAVVLMDVRMPLMDGMETAALIREREKTKDIPIIFLTAMESDRTDIFSGYRAGAVDYISKPFEPVILKAKVSVFADLHRQKQALSIAQKKTYHLYEKLRTHADMLARTNERLKDEIEGHKRSREEIIRLHEQIERNSQERLSWLSAARASGCLTGMC